jgi:hypothetical protein
VLGYGGEPYLRLGPDGAFENRTSPSVAANETRFGQVVSRPGTGAGARPAWRRIADRPVAVWHDHRAHWMSRTPPPAVRAHPGRRQVVQAVSIPLLVGGRPASIVGRLEYLPPPSPWRWLAPALAAGLALAILAWRAPPGIAVWIARGSALTTAGAGTAVAVAEWPDAPTEGLTSGLGSAVPPAGRIALWLAAFAVAVGVWALARRRGRGPEAIVLVAGAWLVGGIAALGRLDVLWSAVVPSVLPADAVRLLVALAVAGLPAPGVWVWRALGAVRAAGTASAAGRPAASG